jgi:polyisoprenoid-binding protein YceI
MTTPAEIPGYQAGTWIIEPVDSDVSFTVRYLGVTRVHGRFSEVAGEIVTGETLGAGDLTIRGVTRPVSMTLQLGGFAADPAGGGRVPGLSAAATITRAEFGFSQKLPADVIGDSTAIQLDVQARLAA